MPMGGETDAEPWREGRRPCGNPAIRIRRSRCSPKARACDERAPLEQDCIAVAEKDRQGLVASPVAMLPKRIEGNTSPLRQDRNAWCRRYDTCCACAAAARRASS